MQLECIIVGDGKRPIRSKTNGPGLENLPGRFVSSSSYLSLSLPPLCSFDITMKTKGHSYQLKKGARYCRRTSIVRARSGIVEFLRAKRWKQLCSCHSLCGSLPMDLERKNPPPSIEGHVSFPPSSTEFNQISSSTYRLFEVFPRREWIMEARWRR